MLPQLREALGLTQDDIADRLQVSTSQVSRWESGRSNIPSERLPQIASAYQCRISDIFNDGDGQFQSVGPTLYVKGEVAAGVWKQACEYEPADWEPYTGRPDITVPVASRFGLVVVGESMNEVYPPGTILDCVSILAGVEVVNGKRVIVQRVNTAGDCEVTVKEYFQDDQGVEWLVPRSRNPSFQSPIRVDQPEDDIVECSIVAVVVGSYRKE